MYYDQEFKAHLSWLGYSENSQSMLPRCVREFLSFTENKPIREIHKEDILNFYEYLEERPNRQSPGGLSSKMIGHYIYALRLFFEYLEQSGEIIANPISSLTFERPESRPREILTREEIHALYETTETLKEKAVIHLFYGCGLRKSEGTRLNIKDIHFRNRILYVREGKGSKRRAVPMTEKICEDLKNYYHHERGKYLKREKETEALIINRRGKRMQGKSYSSLLKQLIQKAGIQKGISLHSLRHSIASHLLESGMSMEYVRDFLGHKHLETTQLYTRVNHQQLKEL
jgi:integrase/recombinase XerD